MANEIIQAFQNSSDDIEENTDEVLSESIISNGSEEDDIIEPKPDESLYAEEDYADIVYDTDTVYATDVVNVRAEPNTECDILGKLKVGDSLERYESMPDGWSRIDYKGQEAYVKTEFLSSDSPERKEYSSDTKQDNNHKQTITSTSFHK